MSNEEIWIDVNSQFIGYKNYECSNLGRIRNKNTQYILNGHLNEDGYLRVEFQHTPRGAYFIHVIILKSFIPNPDPAVYTEVDHINGNILDNRLINLRWSNRLQQAQNRRKRCDKQTSEYIGVDVTISGSGTMRKQELINALTHKMKLSNFEVPHLKELCKEWGIVGYSSLRKDELQKVLCNEAKCRNIGRQTSVNNTSISIYL
jgi:hypothetical protein